MKRICDLVKVMAVVVSFLVPMSEGSVASEPPTAPWCDISGYCRTKTGAPVPDLEIKLLINGGQEPSLTTNSEGYFFRERAFAETSDVRFYPYDGSAWFWDLMSTPEEFDTPYVHQDIAQDFIISPAVRVDLFGGSVSAKGTEVYCYGELVYTFEESDYGYFYPAELNLPLSGSVQFVNPFHKYVDESGLVMNSRTYSCDGKTVARCDGGNIYTHFDPDVSGEYSWTNPGGVGWSCFPATPDNRMPNNPNVFVEVDFDLSTFWPKEYIRLNGVNPIEDLTQANGHVAQFVYPIEDCVRGEYKVEIQPDRNSYGSWVGLTEAIMSGTSDGDLRPDGVINMADLGAFSPLQGLCDGDSNWNPCADYQPDGCINLGDIGVLGQIYNASPSKGLDVASEVGDAYFTPTGEFEGQLVIKADKEWEAAVFHFEIPTKTKIELQWVPVGPFVERSLIVKNEDKGENAYSVFILGPGDVGLSTIGAIRSSISNSLAKIEYSGIELGVDDAPSSKSKAQMAAKASLGSASPNPFNPRTTIDYITEAGAQTRLEVFDIGGHLVKVLVDERAISSGRKEAVWDGRDRSGRTVSAGVYFYRLATGSFSDTKRMVLLK